MKLIDVLEKYSFGRYNENVKLEKNMTDTDIIRIYYDEFSETKWFEFGVYDLGSKDYKMEIITDTLTKKLLNTEVIDFTKDEDTGTFRIYLTRSSK